MVTITPLNTMLDRMVTLSRAMDQAFVNGSPDALGKTAAQPSWVPELDAWETEGEYLVQLDYRIEPVAVDIWVTKIGGAGYHVGYEVTDPPELGSTRYAVAETSLALFDFDTGAPRRMSPSEREVLGGRLAPPPAFRRRRR